MNPFPLTSRVGRLENRITELEGTVSDLLESMEVAADTLNTQNTALSELNKIVKENVRRITVLFGRTFR